MWIGIPVILTGDFNRPINADLKENIREVRSNLGCIQEDYEKMDKKALAYNTENRF